MTILLQHPITDKPEKPGEYWFSITNYTLKKFKADQRTLDEWDKVSSDAERCWYEEIELPDDAIIVQ